MHQPAANELVEFDGVRGGLQLGEAGQDDDGDILIKFSNGAQERQAVHAWHLEVQDQNVERLLGAKFRDGHVGIIERDDLAARGRQQLGDDLAHADIVINDQDS